MCYKKKVQLGNCLRKISFYFVLSENAPNSQQEREIENMSKKMILMDFSYTLMVIGVEVEEKKISLLNKRKTIPRKRKVTIILSFFFFLIKNRSAKIQSKVQRKGVL